MFRKSTNNVLAIDLTSNNVHVLDVKVQKGTPVVSAFATQGVAAGSAESLPERQIKALGELFATQRFKTRKCIATMPMSLVVTRSVSIDKSKPQPAEEQIRWTLQNCLPFDPKDMMFDFWSVQETSSSQRTYEVLVVAAQASVVNRYLMGFEKLRLTCVHLDVAPCAMASLIARSNNSPEAMVGAVALTENSGYFAIIEKQRVLFWRPFDLPQQVAQKGISTVQAALDRIGDEISKCVSHMVGSMHLDTMAELLVFGHGSDDAAFADYLTNRFHLPVRSPSPFDLLPPESMGFDIRNAVQPNIATHYAAAAGLAVQPIGATHG